MAVSLETLLLIICLVLVKNGEAYKDFKEFEPGETLSYGILDISNMSNWLPALQEDKNVPKFKQFLLRLHGVDDLVSFLLGYNNLSSGGNVVVPLVSSTDLTNNPHYASTLYEKLKEAREKRLNYFSHAQLLPVFLTTDDLQNDNKIMMTFRAFERTKIPLGIYIESMDDYFFKTIGTKLSRFEAKNMTTTHIMFRLEASVSTWIHEYDAFVLYMERVLLQIHQAVSGHKIDLTICMISEKGYVTWSSLLTKFLYRWGEEAKCKVMVLHWYGISDFSDMDSYKNSLFRTFQSEDTQLIGTIEYSRFQLLKEICSGKQKLSNIAEIVIMYKQKSQLTKILNSIEESDCGTPLSLKYYSYDPAKSKPPRLDKVLKSIADKIKKNPTSIRGITVSICGENCACSYNVPNVNELSSEIERMKIRNITVDIDACSSWLKHNKRQTLGNGSFISKANFDFTATHDLLLEDLGRVRWIHFDWISGKNVYLDASMKNYRLLNEESCQLVKSHWNKLLNIATIYKFSVALPILGLYRFNLGHAAGTKETTKYGFSATNTGECTYFPAFGNNAFQFNKNLTGVTFNYKLNPPLALAAEDLASLLEFINQPFNKIELVFRDQISEKSGPKLVVDVLQYVQHVRNSTFLLNARDKCEIYVNLEDVELSTDDAKFVKNEYMEIIAGAHINFNSITDKFVDKLSTLQMLKQTFDLVGIVIKYEDATLMAENGFENELMSFCNYVIIHINIVKILSTQYGILPSQVIQEFGGAKLNPEPFYAIFWNIRAWKLSFSQMNPNVTLYARYAWPTTNNRRSTFAFLSVWKFVHDFSTKFEIPFFVYQAFDDLKRSSLGYGWWKLQNSNRNVTDLDNYVEKLADYLNLERKRPDVPTDSGRNETALAFSWTLSNCILVGMAVTVAFLSIISAVVFLRIRLLKRVVILTDQEKEEFEMGMLHSDGNPDIDNHIYGMRYDKDQYEIGRDNFNEGLATAIGRGQFGVVYKYHMPRFNDLVAVKLPNTRDKTQLMSILREIKLMAYIGEHPNVVKLLGAYTAKIQSGYVFVVTEYLENGSLLEYLRNLNKSFDSASTVLLRELCGFCEDIAKGMEYLAEKNVVHGDLAARNVLLDGNNVCKIGDFGMSKQLYSETVYVQTTSKPLPWAWLAVETLDGQVFTLKSDVWSMGVTFWEIFTLGKQPYVEFCWDIEFVRNLRNGLTLPKPELISNEIYEEILKCWTIDPEGRPHPGFFANYFGRQKQDTFYMCL